MRIALCNEILASMPLERQCEYAAALGYDGLELAPFTLLEPGQTLEDIDASRIRTLVESHGLIVTSLHWLLIAPEGLWITSPDPAVRRRTREAIGRMIELCAELGGRIMVHGSPQQRRVPPGHTLETARQWLMEGLQFAAERSARHGIVYCIEPLSRPQTELINTVAEAAALIGELREPALRTMIDCCSASAAESEPIPDLIRRWMPTGLLAHVQVNDDNRRAPGQGQIGFGPILGALRDAGYAGDMAVEAFDYHPDGPGCAAYSIAYLKGLLQCQESRSR